MTLKEEELKTLCENYLVAHFENGIRRTKVHHQIARFIFEDIYNREMETYGHLEIVKIIRYLLMPITDYLDETIRLPLKKEKIKRIEKYSNRLYHKIIKHIPEIKRRIKKEYNVEKYVK